jgi:shikimate kinase
VVALGGGAFAVERNYEMLENNGVTIWLDCPFEVVERRAREAANRPLARDPVRFAELYEARRQAYARADYRIDAAGDDPNGIVEDILKLPIF